MRLILFIFFYSLGVSWVKADNASINKLAKRESFKNFIRVDAKKMLKNLSWLMERPAMLQ